MDAIQNFLIPLIYLLSSALFVFGLKRMTRVKTARSGNQLAAFAMFLAVVGSLGEIGVEKGLDVVTYGWLALGLALGALIGGVAAKRVAMTSMPEMVALLNGTGGIACTFVGFAEYWKVIEDPAISMSPVAAVAGALSIFIGALTFTGSLVAWAKLQGKLNKGKPILLPGRHLLNLLLALAIVGSIVVFTLSDFSQPLINTALVSLVVLTVVSLVIGFTLVIPIGGADMPVVVSLLNSYSGIAVAGTGFVINSPLLIIGGSMVGAAGLILTKIMCDAMNRSLLNVLVGGFGDDGGSGGQVTEYTNVRSCGAAEAAMELEMATNVCIVPGYGLAVAQAQHTVRELGKILEQRGATVTFAIHPVAGRMPGHMNVLLAEADVPYEQLIELETANASFKTQDVVIVIGANDVVNPAALTDKTSPIYGMPILNAHEARRVFVIKRSLGAGYAGVKNELFEYQNTNMVYGDARKILEEMVVELKTM